MAATADDIRRVRVLIPDTEAVFDGETMFSDTDIEDYIFLGGDNLLRAAGLACLAIGSSEALISKKIKTQDLQTDGPAVAAAMAAKAKALFDRADAEDAAKDVPYFDIIDYGEGWTTAPELTEWNWR